MNQKFISCVVLFLSFIFASIDSYSAHESQKSKESEKGGCSKPDALIDEAMTELIKLNVKKPQEIEKFTPKENAINLKVDEALIKGLSFIIDREARAIDNKFSLFSNKVQPPISLADYIARIRKYSDFEASVMITALIYTDRFQTIKGISLNELTVHRIFFVALNLSQKILLDVPLENSQMAKLGGIDLDELNQLERIFLMTLDYDTYVDLETYKEFETIIIRAYEKFI